MIYVTHDQVEAMTLVGKIVVLDAGRVAQVGKPLELYHYPADRFVAGFIGSPKMNFLPVKVTATAIDQVQVELPMPNRQQVWLPVESRDVQVGANMSLGIRPEHLLPSDIADVILEGEVQVVEQLGNETQIHIQIPSIRQNLVYRQNDVVLVEEGLHSLSACRQSVAICSVRMALHVVDCIRSRAFKHPHKTHKACHR